MEDGRYNIVLDGMQRFNVLKELKVDTEFRQVEAELWEEDELNETLSIAERAALEIESRKLQIAKAMPSIGTA